MPDPNEEQKDIQEAVPQIEKEPQDEKRRIKPVIEEVAGDSPVAGDEAAKEETPETDGPEEPDKKTDEEETGNSGEIKQPEELPVYERKPEPVNDEPKSDIKLFVFVAVITAVVVAALAGGIYVYMTGTNNLENSPAPTPESTVAPEGSPVSSPESSPSAELELSEFKVQILNGSGKIGEAGKAKTLLEKAGFKVGNTGNAAAFDFTDSVIQIKNSVSEDVLDKVKSSLSSVYSVKIGDILDSDSDYDIVITVGSE